VGWVELGQLADGLGWVTQNGPMDNSVANKVSPRGRRDDMPPSMVKIAADLRPCADGSAVRTSLVAGGG